MKVQRISICTLIVAALGCASMATAADWGNLCGRFLVKGTPPTPAKIDIMGKDPEVCGKHDLVNESIVVAKDGGLANVIIWVRTKKVAVNPEYKKTAADKVVLDNHNCRFEPHVITLRVGQTLELKNSDPMGHNTNLGMIANPQANVTLPSGGTVDEKYEEQETLPCKVACNIHPWMNAWLLVRPDPYMAVSDKEGKFELKDLPAGELEFQVWQENIGYIKKAKIGGMDSGWTKKGEFKKTIKAGANDLGDITIDVAAFKK